MTNKMTNSSSSPSTFWLTWEDHRRSRELAKAFQAQYVALTGPETRYLRYFYLGGRTLCFLALKRPKVLFCQNPSLILNALLCLLQPFFKYRLIADRHSNFKLYTLSSGKIKWRIFHTLSRYTARHSTMTIVTNEHLKNVVEEYGGNAFILPDRIPQMNSPERLKLKGSLNIVFISTFSKDEPIDAVIEVARNLDRKIQFYITGNFKKHEDIKKVRKFLPKNVSLTGFLSEEKYQQLISSADILMVITDQEYILNCGAYEAVSLGIPMILGNTRTIRNYFYKGAIYTNPDALSLEKSIDQAIRSRNILKDEIVSLKEELEHGWNKEFDKLRVGVNK